MRALPVLLAVAVGGCVYTQPVSLASAEGRAEVNARAQRGHPVVSVEGQRGRQVQGLHLGPEVATWTDKKTGEPRSAPTVSVTDVTFRRDGAGALKGLAVGAAIGAAAGLLVSAVDPGESVILTPEVWVGVGAGGGGFTGLFVGAIHSEQHVYQPADAPSGRAGVACGGPPLTCAVSRPRRL